MCGVVPHYQTEQEGCLEPELWPSKFMGLVCMSSAAALGSGLVAKTVLIQIHGWILYSRL